MKKALIKTTIISITCFLISVASLAQDGSLDTTFGTFGKVLTLANTSKYDDGYNAVAIQPDGKIVMAGNSSNGTNRDFVVIRYNSNGSLDTTFGTGGKVATDIGTGDDIGNSVVIQPDGKIVVAGLSYIDAPIISFAIVRYNSNGSLDTTFGTGGKVTTAMGTTYHIDYGTSVALQPDGKIIVAGYTYPSGVGLFKVVRYNTDGSLDATFGTLGIVTTSLGTGNSYGYSVALQPDGKIVVAGYCNESANNIGFALVRYTSNGILDTTFGTGGKVTTAVGSNAYGRSVAIQPDGKIVVAGYTYVNPKYVFVVVRYNTNGSLDTAFGTGGKVTTIVGSGYSEAYNVAIQPNGKIVVAGTADLGDNNYFGVVRYTSNGSLDSTFGIGGKVITEVGPSNSEAYSIAFQPDGKIVLAGHYTGPGGNFAIVRYNNALLETETFALNPFKIHPNPAKTSLHIESQEYIQIEKITILNLLGETVLSQIVESLSEVELNIEKLTAGMYVLQVTENNKKTNTKFIKI